MLHIVCSVGSNTVMTAPVVLLHGEAPEFDCSESRTSVGRARGKKLASWPIAGMINQAQRIRQLQRQLSVQASCHTCRLKDQAIAVKNGPDKC